MNFSRDRKNLKNRRKGKAGFTMSELLIVVAIVIVLFAVAVLSLVTIQKNLRQKELDCKAEILYVAVQNRMSELRAGGYESLYQYDENKDNGVAKVGLIPLDAPEEDAEDAITKDTLCYVVSANRVEVGKAAASVLPESSVDAELWNNHWVIEYDPESGSVYSAFYSEEEITSGDVSTTLPTYLNRMRVRQTRLHNGAKIGYYGGARVISGTTDTLKPDISIDNREKLTATFYCNNPYADELTFNIKVSDGRNEYVKVVKYSELRQLNSKTWYYTWVMDSLESEKTRFYNQTDHKLACGADITVTLSVESQNANVDGKSYTRKTNSLFRYAESTPAGTALIAYGRHLQNLDEASHVSDTITGAVQVSDLSFADDTADNEDWYSFYGDTFTPITNKNLKSYDGYSEVDNVKLYSSISNLHITDTSKSDVGLFSTFNGEIKNVTLTGMKIDGGQNVGALIGSVSDTVKITNTRVYLSSKKGDLADIETVDSPEKVQPWLEGKIVGGLIGMVTETGSVSVTDSSASTVIRADGGAAGGLIGAVYKAATITDSYADCYLTAARTGGLIAKAEGGSEVAATGTSITLKDFYAAGYQTATGDAFGLVGGSNVIATGGYSACVYNVGENAKVHSTVNTMGSASNVYYLTDGGLSGDGISKWENDNQTKPKTYKELSESGFAKEEISEAFTSSSGAATFPYNLMDQGLTYYTYPRLEKLNHYGDWQAEFESGALVYYERYEDETYGFYGANLSTLKTSKFVVGDGYALAYIDQKKATDTPPTVIYAENKDANFAFNGEIQTTDDATNTKYYLYPLSKEVVNTDYIDTAEPDTFYQKITIEDTANSTNTEYYYNPHFAKTVTVNENKPQAPETVCIRSARQLYALSLYYPQYADAVKDSVFRQELNIDYSRYEWTNYDVVPAKINTQAPIGTGDKPFTAVYNGGCNTIEGISFKANSLHIGMFGYTSSAAAVRNVFLVGDGSNTVAYVNAQGGNSASGSASRVSMGVLVGYNRGTVSNCSVSGYTMEYYGYSASTASLGGFVGSNYGTIRNSASDCPSIRFANTNSNTYAGGFAGVNHASISDSYALGSIQVRGARNSTVWVAGFAANNASGMIRRSYSATALTASGDAESYGFAHTGGSAYQCYYLDGGTYSYRGTLYAYNTSKNEFKDNAAGEPLTGSELQNKTISNFKTADYTYNVKETTGDYIYPAVVRNAAGKTVHYGDWPVQKDIGTLGVFYWEYEDSGSNSGYHFSYVGTSQGNEISSANNDILKGDSLCEEHDDGGVVTHYGYGYFYANSNNLTTSLSAAYFNENFMRVAENAKAGEALGKQMPGYTFVAYETGANMYLQDESANGVWQLRYGDGYEAATYTYTINPFFADAISLDASYVNGIVVNTDDAKPGTTTDNAYEIRSVSQLQFINWNSGKSNTNTSIVSQNQGDWDTFKDKYTYQVYGDTHTVSGSGKELYWNQTHDLNASLEYSTLGKANNFTPIGSMYDNAGDTAKADPTMSYFASHYDGQAYTIKNVEIHSNAECVGIFGITVGATVKNVVVYSDEGNVIEATKDGMSWYCVGGLVGFAAGRDNPASVFTNCTVSGYTI